MKACGTCAFVCSASSPTVSMSTASALWQTWRRHHIFGRVAKRLPVGLARLEALQNLQDGRAEAHLEQLIGLVKD